MQNNSPKKLGESYLYFSRGLWTILSDHIMSTSSSIFLGTLSTTSQVAPSSIIFERTQTSRRPTSPKLCWVCWWPSVALVFPSTSRTVGTGPAPFRWGFSWLSMLNLKPRICSADQLSQSVHRKRKGKWKEKPLEQVTETSLRLIISKPGDSHQTQSRWIHNHSEEGKDILLIWGELSPRFATLRTLSRNQ